MDIEQIKKHGEVIKWFVDNPEKGVWAKHPKEQNKWILTYRPNWYTSGMYVQNDKYTKFRKAQTDGKTIEYQYGLNSPSGVEWRELLAPCHFEVYKNYRIKPEEPEFKPGDWVINTTQKTPIPHQFPNIPITHLCSHIKLWKPQVGEWCVFWDYDEELSTGALTIDLFKEQSSTGYVSENISGTFKHIAPLESIQTLKEP